MRPIVSDAGPLHYLVLIEAIECLPRQFGRVLIPQAVAAELSHPATPSVVRAWLGAPPSWIEVRAEPEDRGKVVRQRGAGEVAAIRLATSTDAKLLLIDDRVGDAAARACGLETIGTLGVLIREARSGRIDLPEAFRRLSETNFRVRPDLLDALLVRYNTRRDE